MFYVNLKRFRFTIPLLKGWHIEFYKDDRLKNKKLNINIMYKKCCKHIRIKNYLYE